jgi:hypothetical protein
MVYRWKKELKIKTYEPQKRIKIHKQEAFSWLHLMGSKFMHMGGGLSLFFSGIFISIRAFFHTKGKLREIQMKNEKVIYIKNSE